MTQYKDYRLRYVIVGKNVSVYNEGEFYDYIKKYNITFLLLFWLLMSTNRLLRNY